MKHQPFVLLRFSRTVVGMLAFTAQQQSVALDSSAMLKYFDASSSSRGINDVSFGVESSWHRFDATGVTYNPRSRHIAHAQHRPLCSTKGASLLCSPMKPFRVVYELLTAGSGAYLGAALHDQLGCATGHQARPSREWNTGNSLRTNRQKKRGNTKSNIATKNDEKDGRCVGVAMSHLAPGRRTWKGGL